MSEDFRQRLRSLAEKSVSLSSRCTNEESTKLFLILPFISFLGYDDRNPDEVCPEHSADLSEKYKNRVDFAILKDSTPVIAIECKCNGMALKDERGQLRAYFNAAPTVKMGILTDGLSWEFYADSDEPNMMDQSAFLSIDLREISKGKIEDSLVDGLKSLQKPNFDPDNIGAEAKRKLVFQSILNQINQLALQPSEPFARMLLQNAGIKHVRASALDQYYELIRSAFSEYINLRILKRLDIDLPSKEKEGDKTTLVADRVVIEPPEGIETTDIELEVYNYVKRRLAFLVTDQVLFDELEHISAIIPLTHHNIYRHKPLILRRD